MSWNALSVKLLMLHARHSLFQGSVLHNIASLFILWTLTAAESAGESERRNVLDAFFLGKALAETLNERIESTVGEFLSTIGRLQAEQQKQVQDFQVNNVRGVCNTV